MFRDKKQWSFVAYLLTVLVLFLVLGVRLFYLQIVRGDYYRSLSSQNHIRIITRPAPRGLISDRNGVVLADSRPSFIVTAVPSEFDSLNIVQVAFLLNMQVDALSEILSEASSVPHRPVVLRESMSVEEVSSIAENIYRIPGVLIDVAPLRRYHRAEDFCHVIGYVGLADDPESFRGEITGRTGIELSLNGTLQGNPGLHREVVDAMGRIVEEYRGTESEEPVPGKNVVLTLDAELQRTAFENIGKTGLPGAVVIMNYRNGDILCAASSPSFDTNMFSRGITQDEWNALLQNPENPLYCRAWAASYPPASTFKIITAYWLIAEDLIDEKTMPAPCYGSLTLGDTEFGCWRAHGRMNVIQALAQSCDVFFYRTSQLGSLNELAEYAGFFGLGSRLTEVLTDERNGLVPDSDYLNSTYGPDGWGLGNLLNVSIGQGELLTTPLQMAAMTGVIASSGRMPLPRILLHEEERDPLFPVGAIDDFAFDIVIEGMLQTVVSRKGTLNRVFLDYPWDFWGKTGTAECSGENHAIVVGFTREPEPVVICVIIEHGGHGGSIAGPLARDILLSYFEGSD
ncbi:MAG: penicillin-binding protein 2 [Candidatus Aegiribacteria sp.]|nr:penicillin-binding protein 2 [Candidatus Aegiribacteria sp.]